MTPTAEYVEVLKLITMWPIDRRIALAHEVLESATNAMTPPDAIHPSFERARGIAKTGNSAPDDGQIRRWIGEHRMEKYE